MSEFIAVADLAALLAASDLQGAARFADALGPRTQEFLRAHNGPADGFLPTYRTRQQLAHAGLIRAEGVDALVTAMESQGSREVRLVGVNGEGRNFVALLSGDCSHLLAVVTIEKADGGADGTAADL
jgi:hypothetical protein